MTKYYLLINGNWREESEFIYNWLKMGSMINYKNIYFGIKVTPKPKPQNGTVTFNDKDKVYAS